MTSRGQCPRGGGVRLVFHPSKFRPHPPGWLATGLGVLIGWHCAKVQGHAELEIEKPRVKTLVKISPNYTIPNPTVFVLTPIYAKVSEKR